MRQANLGAVRPFATAAVLVLLAAPTFGQVVEKGRTFADLTASHPCTNGLTERIARVIDCDAADDVGDGGGAFQCWVRCDGSAPWETVAIGAGGGGLPGADEVTEAMLKSVNGPTDEYMLTYESTTGDFEWQAPATGDVVGPASATNDGIATYDDTTGKLLKSNTIQAIAGQLLLPQGSCATPNVALGGNADTGWYNASDAFFGYCHQGALVGFIDNTKFSLFDANYQFAIGNSGPVGFGRLSAGVAKITNGSSGYAWLQQTQGRAALDADFTSTSATPANLSALTITLLAGRKYTFRMALRFSDSTAADGARFDFDGGTATATDFGVNCQVFDSALLVSLDATALATDLVATTTTGASKIVCDGSFTVNAAGTFIPRAGQEAASGGTLTVETGSYIWVEDTPFI